MLSRLLSFTGAQPLAPAGRCCAVVSRHQSRALATKAGAGRDPMGRYDWTDPLRLAEQLTDEERQVRMRGDVPSRSRGPRAR